MGQGKQIVKAMALIRRPGDGALLVSEHTDPLGVAFHRPLGGHVEFGEYSQDTVHREFAEELGQGLSHVRLLGVVENLFEWAGAPRHEIVFVYAASFADSAAYQIAEQSILDEPEAGVRVTWRPDGATSPPLYPEGVADLAAMGGDTDARQRGSV
jgi:ADP-ribose pyrophosphatase YjhB (NUDIX family)